MSNGFDDNLHYFAAEINYVGGSMHRIDSPSEIVFHNVPPHTNSTIRMAAEINRVRGGVTRERSGSRMTVSYANGTTHTTPQDNPHPQPVQRHSRSSLVINRGSPGSGGRGDYSGYCTGGRDYQRFDGQRNADSRHPRSPYSGNYYNGYPPSPGHTQGKNYTNASGNRRGYSGTAAKARPTPYDRSNRKRGDNFDSLYYNSNARNVTSREMQS
ncbi:hypothetical protein C8F04DRAFT_1082227 [Mycena alexandri]|uniref:Uncharacterized protein n=1 Tax=Mycena alexandri TaxID=1745969 RepID=A0AAD6T8H5_9AGAR|nr:hypothetical protein C8F04DRAFT_1082227 [Mycena alexandri]